jgi:hypothetical protein
LVASRQLEPKATLQPRRRARAERSPSARWLWLCGAAVLTALTAAAAAQSAPTARLKTPELDAIGRAAGPIPDTLIGPPTTRALAPNGYWGGQYRTNAGELVTIYASNSYPMDASLGQRWADFLSSLVHGSEISSVTVLLSTPGQIEGVCGQDALACYSARGSLLYAPGEDPTSSFSAEAVVAHEYGHHIAANRNNAPWDALDWGPKRWASAIQVCARAKKGELAPGAEDPVRYESNPGEGWAETYRVLNQRKLGVPESPWQIVSQSLYPTTAVLAAAELDVTSPWASDTTTHRHGYANLEDADVQRCHAARRHDEGDSEIFGGPAREAGRIRILDARRAGHWSGHRYALAHGLRRPQLQGAGDGAGGTRVVPALGRRALSSAS